jgi:RNA polymerase sigma-70 factor, ECF subfamily
VAGTHAAPPDFHAIFQEHAPFVWRMLRGMGVPRGAIDDTVQEVFLTVHARLPEFEGRSRLRTWICAITYRIGANARRKVQRRCEVEFLETDQRSLDPSPEEQTEVAESTRFVQKFCDQLDEGMRDVFVLCLLDERPAAEVGELLGISPNTVSSRVRLLRDSFRKSLVRHHEIQEER